MQMGRWCGYRKGYEDLVRLYIGRAEPAGKTKTLDLYRAFEMMSRDEEDFRAQLAMYAKSSGITPKDVPALVFNSHPQLRPAARNKMFNAEVTWAGFAYREPTSQAVAVDEAKGNLALFDRLFKKHGVRVSTATIKTDGSVQRFGTQWCEASNKEVLDILTGLSWDKAGSGIDAEIKYLGRKETPVDSWIVLAPQIGQETGGGVWPLGGHEFRCILRTRFENRFGVFTSPEHVALAKWLVGEPRDVECASLKPRVRTGVLLLYPAKIKIAPKKAKTGPPATGFALVLPAGSPEHQRIAFRVKMPSDPDSVVVSLRKTSRTRYQHDSPE
jgi:hypothetical protein